eukprot:19678-Rhodomonas_salina.5
MLNVSIAIFLIRTSRSAQKDGFQHGKASQQISTATVHPVRSEESSACSIKPALLSARARHVPRVPTLPLAYDQNVGLCNGRPNKCASKRGTTTTGITTS